jgi:hypothetical protein
MGAYRSSTDCAQLVADGATTSCTTHVTITEIDQSWGLPGLGAEGTVALGGMAMASAIMIVLACRALMPVRTGLRVTRR